MMVDYTRGLKEADKLRNELHALWPLYECTKRALAETRAELDAKGAELAELCAVLAHWMFFIESEAGCPEQLPWVERARRALGHKNTEDV